VADKKTDEYNKEEAAQRLVAALKGARLAGHIPMKAKKAANKTKTRKAKKAKPRKRV
jgi:hypothetical protein